MNILAMGLSKVTWKNTMKRNVFRYGQQWLEKEVIEKSTLNLLNHSTTPNSVHVSFKNLQTKTDICRANTKWRILTSTDT